MLWAREKPGREAHAPGADALRTRCLTGSSSAYHPFGVVDGLVLAYLLSRRRSDFRLLVHWLLLRVPEPRPWLLPVDFTDSRAAREANAITRVIQ